MIYNKNQNQIKSSLYSSYYAEACNELRVPSPRLSAWATQLRRNVATVASRWRRCADLTGPGIEAQTSRTDSVRFATELTAGLYIAYNHFEMVAFLKDNQLFLLYRLSYPNRSLLPFGFNVKMNNFGLNTHHGALGLQVKNWYFFFGFAAYKKVTVTSYFFKFVAVTKLLFLRSNL